ncbi:MAG: sugar transferase [Lachnospiraceae bacterium]|nr:sugar transferase [Lachnospiraceae bacterium]
MMEAMSKSEMIKTMELHAEAPAIKLVYQAETIVEHDVHIKSKAYEAVKRTLDILLSIAALILLSPVFLIVAILIKLEDGDPVIFRQLRTGKDGEEFFMYKFRSMCKNAPDMHADLLVYNEMQSGPAFKLKNDPRITKVGNFIRKTSIDELPQLLNIIKGEMSIVGPRPLPTYETKQCNALHKRRLLVRPGLTCYWQVNGRNNIEFDEWMEMDWKYVKERSLITDTMIFFKTIGAVISGDGAA